ncbi:unnamed protein product [Choristocarpus tenellus]
MVLVMPEGRSGSVCFRALVMWLVTGGQIAAPVVEGFLAVGPLKIPSSSCVQGCAEFRLCVSATSYPLSSEQKDDQEQVEGHESSILKVEKGEEGSRLDAFLTQRAPKKSRSYFGGLCKDGLIRVDGKAAKKSVKLELGQVVEVPFVINPTISVGPEDIPLDIIYEDEDIIAISKPAGMVVHPAPGNMNGTFVNALVHHLQQNCEDEDMLEGGSRWGDSDELDALEDDGEGNAAHRPGIVHRLDKGTTGVLLAAKNLAMQVKLCDLFAAREVKKSYLTVCVGNPGQDAVIDVPIGRHPFKRQRMVAVPDVRLQPNVKSTIHVQPNVKTRNALSVVDTVAFDGKLSVAKVAIETGRTHQIRVHLQHRRTPVLGDDVYGNNDWNKRLLQSTGLARPLLHAYSLEFKHPLTGEKIMLCAPLPADVSKIVEKIYPQVHEENPEWVGGAPKPKPEPERIPIPGDVPESLRDYSIC